MADKGGAGLIAGAKPTAPGGMSQSALIDELLEKHGWTKARTKPLSPLSEWKNLIDTVCQERLAREAEERALRAEQREAEVPRVKTSADLSAAYGGGAAKALRDEAVSRFAEGMDMPEELITGTADEYEDLVAEFEALSERTAPDGVEPDSDLGAVFLPDPTTADYIFDGHMGIGPSSAERWMTCTASVAAVKAHLGRLTGNQQAQAANAGLAARQGTTAHAVAEVEANALLGRVTSDEAETTLLELALMPEDEGEAYDDEMAAYVTEYTDLISSYADERGTAAVRIEEVVEAWVDLLTVDADGEREVHGIRGAADAIILPTREHPTLVVADLKYGEGIDVDVESNPQIRIYGIGALDFLADPETGKLPEWVTEITYHIVQPRLGGIKTWTESIDDLLDWRDGVLSKALTEALGGAKGGAAFNPNPVSCQWCPVRGSCPALAAQRMESAAELFDVIQDHEYENGAGEFPETAQMDNTTLGRLYAQVTGLTNLAKDLKAEAQRRLYRGEEVPGFGLVNYQPPRKWVEGADLELAETPEVWTEKMISPTAAEKLLGPETYEETIKRFVVKPEKVPVVAPEGDRRSKWEGKAPEAMFADESGAE